MTVRNDMKRLSLARAGIVRLCSGEAVSAQELFGVAANSPRWGYQLLRRMRDLQLVSVTREENRAGYVYRGSPELVAYRDDEEALANLLWPSLGPVVPAALPSVDDPDGDPTSVARVVADVAEPASESAPRAAAPATPGGSEPTEREMLVAILRLSAAIAESVGRQNAHLVAIQDRLSNLEKVWT